MLKTRVITALLLIATFIPALFLSSNTAWAIGMLFVSLLAIYEWGNLINLSKIESRIYTLFCGVLGAAMLFYMQKNGFHWFLYQSLLTFMFALIFWVLIIPILLSRLVVVQNKYLLAIIGFLLIAPLWLALISAKSADPWLLLALLSTIWIADTAAYFSGKNFGKHKLAPSISPGKTWEGVMGAVLAVTAFSAVLYCSDTVSSWTIFPLLWLVALLGVVGDLFESLIKRQVNKKDSGDLLPGHGGILDRIDGLVPSLPIAVLMIYLFNYYQVAN
ncbi:MAG: phosphatidate cytidylyltransferase [Methylophilaceae bacterium]